MMNKGLINGDNNTNRLPMNYNAPEMSIPFSVNKTQMQNNLGSRSMLSGGGVKQLDIRTGMNSGNMNVNKYCSN
jgi:hypothetical protein